MKSQQQGQRLFCSRGFRKITDVAAAEAKRRTWLHQGNCAAMNCESTTGGDGCDETQRCLSISVLPANLIPTLGIGTQHFTLIINHQYFQMCPETEAPA